MVHLISQQVHTTFFCQKHSLLVLGYSGSVLGTLIICFGISSKVYLFLLCTWCTLSLLCHLPSASRDRFTAGCCPSSLSRGPPRATPRRVSRRRRPPLGARVIMIVPWRLCLLAWVVAPAAASETTGGTICSREPTVCQGTFSGDLYAATAAPSALDAEARPQKTGLRDPSHARVHTSCSASLVDDGPSLVSRGLARKSRARRGGALGAPLSASPRSPPPTPALLLRCLRCLRRRPSPTLTPHTTHTTLSSLRLVRLAQRARLLRHQWDDPHADRAQHGDGSTVRIGLLLLFASGLSARPPAPLRRPPLRRSSSTPGARSVPLSVSASPPLCALAACAGARGRWCAGPHASPREGEGEGGLSLHVRWLSDVCMCVCVWRVAVVAASRYAARPVSCTRPPPSPSAGTSIRTPSRGAFRRRSGSTRG